MARPNHKTSIHIEDKHLDGNNYLEVEVSYDKGGINYFNYQRHARGYYLTVRPVTIENGCRSMMLGKGRSCFLEEVKAFNAKRLDYWAANHPKEKVDELSTIILKTRAESAVFRYDFDRPKTEAVAV